MQATDARPRHGLPGGNSTPSVDTLLVCLACTAKLLLPPACAHLLSAPKHPRGDCETAHLSHGRGSAGEALPGAAAPFAMGAAAEVATMPHALRPRERID